MSFDVFFWLAIIAVYLFQALAKNKKRTGTNLPPSPDGEQAASPSDFQSTLSEISRMLQGEPPSNPPDLIEPTHRWEREEPTEPEIESPWLGDRTSSASIGAPVVGSFYDQEFENRIEPTFHKPVITHDHEFDFSAFSIEKETDGSELRRMLRSDLRDRAKTREAFLLSELLGPPLSKKNGLR